MCEQVVEKERRRGGEKIIPPSVTFGMERKAMSNWGALRINLTTGFGAHTYLHRAACEYSTSSCRTSSFRDYHTLTPLLGTGVLCCCTNVN